MKREFLENLGLEKETVDKIMAEHGASVEREKDKVKQVKEDLEKVKEQLEARDNDLNELKKTAGDAKEIQDKLDELQKKYDTETQDYLKQIQARDYADAMSSAISGASIKFSSKAAEKAFRDELKNKALNVKDGKLEGFDAFLKTQKEADPDAFAPDKPNPFIRQSGGGDPGGMSAGALAAQKFNAQYVAPKE